MSLAQAILGSHHVSTNSSSFDPSHSTKMPNSTLVNVHVQTRTEVDTERRGENVVQLELADWKRAEEEKVRFAGDI